jgi:hypothetical protein
LKKTKKILLNLTYYQQTQTENILGEAYNCFYSKNNSLYDATYTYTLSEFAQNTFGFLQVGSPKN